MLQITARVTAHKGKEAELKARLMELVKTCAHHKGMHTYRLHQHTKDPASFLFYEQYENESAFKAHTESSELIASQEMRKPITASRELDCWTLLDESGSATTSLDALECIHTRRSIRSFTDAPLDDAHVQLILEAAMTAPSAGNSQPWEFILIRNKDSHKHIMSIHPYAKMLEHAPLAVLVCGNLQKERYPGFWVQDCSAAIQNMLLAARALGVGTVWCGIHPKDELINACQQHFTMPKHIMPLGLVVMGMPAQYFTKRDTFDRAKIHEEYFAK